MKFGIILVGYWFPSLFKDGIIQGHVTLIYITKLILKSDFAAAGVEGVKVSMAHVMLPETVSFTPINLILDEWAVWAVFLDYNPFTNLQGYISEKPHHLLFFRYVSDARRFSWGLKVFPKCCGGVELLCHTSGNILNSECRWELRGNLTLPSRGAPATPMGHAAVGISCLLLWTNLL